MLYRLFVVLYRLFVSRWLKVAEAVLVAAASAVVLVILIYSVPDCRPLRGFQQQDTGSNKTGARDLTSQRGNDSVVSDNGNYGEHLERVDPYGDHGHGFVIRVRDAQTTELQNVNLTVAAELPETKCSRPRRVLAFT